MTADIGNLRIGQAPQGVKPPTASASAAPAQPASPPPPTPATPPVSVVATPAPVASRPIIAPSAPPTITIPQNTDSGTGPVRKIIYGVLALFIVGGIAFSLVSLFGGSNEPIALESPSSSPSPAATLESTGKTLRSYFPQAGATITLHDDDAAVADFRNALGTTQPPAGQAQRLILETPWTDAGAFGFLSAMIGTVPTSLQESLADDWAVLTYGQTEQFDAGGTKLVGEPSVARVVIIAEVADATSANQALTTWETSALASSADTVLGYDFSKAIVPGFSPGTYRQLQVRYWNFPYADTSIDYAIVTASNNKNYLIISSSRESMFFVIDKMMQ